MALLRDWYYDKLHTQAYITMRIRQGKYGILIIDHNKNKVFEGVFYFEEGKTGFLNCLTDAIIKASEIMDEKQTQGSRIIKTAQNFQTVGLFVDAHKPKKLIEILNDGRTSLEDCKPYWKDIYAQQLKKLIREHTDNERLSESENRA